ncbi:MAG: hypothetical protein LUH46_07750 [Alistipes sp.]|nr:hypothetical protein [Alistipes sp.]
MELKDLQITDDLWDFIAANVPSYHEREEVLRQAQLQLFIAGHESLVAGITREEAILLRDNILHGLFAEAIAAFTHRMPEQKALEAKLDTIYGSEELRERFAEILLNEAMTDTESYHKVARSIIDAYMERDCDALLTSICGWSISSLAEKVLNNQ